MKIMQNNNPRPREVIISEGELSMKIMRNKSKHAMDIKKLKELKEKEEGWNDRHHIEHMQPYNNPYYQIKGKSKNREKEQRYDYGKVRKKNDPSLEKNQRKDNRTHNRLHVDEMYKEAFKTALNDLRLKWEQHGIPEFHTEAVAGLLLKVGNFQLALDRIKMEYVDLQNGKAIIQEALDNVDAREACLLELQDQISKSIEVSPSIEEKLQHLRRLTIAVVESISKWKKYLESLSPKEKLTPQPIFKFDGANYLHKLQKDTTFLYSLPYSKQLGLSHRVDPLLGAITSKSLSKQAKACERILSEQKNESETTFDQGKSKTNRGIVQNSPIKPPKREDKGTIKGKRKDIEAIKRQREEEEQQQRPMRYMLKEEEFVPWLQSLKAQTENAISFIFGNQPVQNFGDLGVISLRETYTVVGVDKNYHLRRVHILFMGGSLRTSSLKSVLSEVLEYIWGEDFTGEVRVSLNHEKIDQSYALNKDLETIFKEVGFRWKLVNNDRHSGQRSTVMAVSRPSSAFQPDPTQPFHLQVQNLLLLRPSQVGVSARCEWFSSDINELSLERYAKEKLGTVREQRTQQLRKLGGFTFSGIRNFTFANQNELIKVASDNYLRLGVVDSFAEESLCSIINLSFKWVNYSFVTKKHSSGKSSRFVRFENSEDRPLTISRSPLLSSPIYFVPTDEEQYSFFIVEAADIKSLDQVNQGLLAMQEQRVMEGSLWMPLFSKLGKSSGDLGSHTFISTDFKSGLSSLMPREEGTVLGKRLCVGMINQQLLGHLESPVWLATVEERDCL